MPFNEKTGCFEPDAWMAQQTFTSLKEVVPAFEKLVTHLNDTLQNRLKGRAFKGTIVFQIELT